MNCDGDRRWGQDDFLTARNLRDENRQQERRREERRCLQDGSLPRSRRRTSSRRSRRATTAAAPLRNDDEARRRFVALCNRWDQANAALNDHFGYQRATGCRTVGHTAADELGEALCHID